MKRHAITVPSLTRTVDSWMKTKDGPKRIVREEMVQMHDIYHEDNSKVLYHRGAKVGEL